MKSMSGGQGVQRAVELTPAFEAPPLTSHYHTVEEGPYNMVFLCVYCSRRIEIWASMYMQASIIILSPDQMILGQVSLYREST